MDVLSIFCMYRHFSCFQYGFQNGHQWSRDYLFIIGSNKSFIYKQHSVKFHSDSLTVLEILCVKPIYPQYSGVLETCLALRYWFFEVLGSESVN